MIKAFLLLLVVSAVCATCPSGTYDWLGQCCDPTITCPPGVPTGKIQPFLQRSMCLEALEDNTVLLNLCSNDAQQRWTLEYTSGRMRLRLDSTTLCLTRTSVVGASPILSNCDYNSTADETQWFEYNGGLLQRYDAVYCLATTPSSQVAQVPCDGWFADSTQFWVSENLSL